MKSNFLAYCIDHALNYGDAMQEEYAAYLIALWEADGRTPT